MKTQRVLLSELSPPKRINVGCGDVPLKGFANFDVEDFDACVAPWPFSTASIEQVNMDCVLPHIPQPGHGERDPFDVLINETARVLTPDVGLFTFSVPDWRKPVDALQDVYHYRIIGPRTFHHYAVATANRPLEAKGLWFQKPTWTHRQIQDGALEGESKVLPGLLRVGQSNLGVLSHLAFRLKASWLLRTGRLDWSMKRNGSEWVER